MPSPPMYRERLRPSFGWWCAGAGAGLLLGLVAWPVDEGVGVGLGAAGAVAAWALLWWTAPVLAVSDGTLRAGRARIPVRLLRGVEPLSAEAMRHALGPGLDGRAYVCLRTWSRTGVRIELADALDPTPYWLVSTRRPAALAHAVAQERTRCATSR